jgi:hypothetical protein
LDIFVSLKSASVGALFFRQTAFAAQNAFPVITLPSFSVIGVNITLVSRVLPKKRNVFLSSVTVVILSL